MSTTESTPTDPMNPDSRTRPTPTTPAMAAMTAESPGFLPPKIPRGPDPLDPSQTTTRPLDPQEVDYAEPGTDGEPPGSTSTDRRTTGPSRGYTPDSDPAGFLRAQPSAYEGMIATAVRLGGLGLDSWRSPETHIWMPTDDEVRGMTEPLARIAARHTPLPAGDDTSDLLDGLTVGVVAAGYAIRATSETRQLRAELVHAAQNGQATYPG